MFFKELPKNSFYPALKDSGFKMDGYYVWCSSVIKEGDTFYMFAARWPMEKTFPNGYLTDSEIVLATSDSLDKPFTFKKVIISKRDGGYWDSAMAHNPSIIKIGDEFVLYYIGSPDGGVENRAIGYATAKSLDGDWVRSDKPIALPKDANNPAPLIDKDGSILLYYRDGRLKVSVARADKYDGEYEILKYDIFPHGMVEDMFVYHTEDGYEIVAEDAGGAYTGLAKAGVHFLSKNGIDYVPHEVPLVYGYDVEYDDGTKIELTRRERPMLIEEDGKLYLFNGAKLGGETRLTGGITWSMVQQFKFD